MVIRDQFLFRKLDSKSVIADISKVSNAESMSSEDIAQLFDNYEPEKPEESQPNPRKSPRTRYADGLDQLGGLLKKDEQIRSKFFCQRLGLDAKVT